MTRCNDKESDEQSNEAAEKAGRKKKSKEEKHVSFPPDEQIVSGFAEHRNKKGKKYFYYCERAVNMSD